MTSIRPVAICVVRRGDRLLGFDVPDPVKGVTGFRPLGGGIEWGETSRDAVVREMREELGAELTRLRLLGTIENIFTFQGETGHEVVFAYEADFVDPGLYDGDTIDAREDTGDEFVAKWRPLDSLRGGRMPLYPEGLLELVDRVEKVVD